MAENFDFIIVGGGTAGCLLASRLSDVAARPSVLLIESGGDGLLMEHRPPYQRFNNAFVLPHLDHGYSTVPQPGLGGRSVQYQRGKGLGGSSMLNFLIWTRGSSFDWEMDPKTDDHGYESGLAISAPMLEEDVRTVMKAGVELGLPLSLDNNSGNIIGVSGAQLSYANGVRSTSERAFLTPRPGNLTVWTHSQVARILFANMTAVGVETTTGQKAFASKEVIITAGAIDSPKLLLLSGIGPKKELKDLDINIIYNAPGVGKNAFDHLQVIITHWMDRSFSGHFDFALDEARNKIAAEKWAKSHDGPYSEFFGSSGIIFGKDESTYETEAFQALDTDLQNFIRNPAVPHWEIAFAGPLIPPNFEKTGDRSFSSHVTVQMNPTSKGQITLHSKDPLMPPLIDPKYLSNPYDKIMMIAAIRAEQQLVRTETMRKHYVAPISAPKSDSDEDILSFVGQTAGPLWHFSSTVKMGKSTDETAVVDSRMKVFGVKNLRVADISICPFNMNAHTQAPAYLIGQTAADFIIAEHYPI